MRSGASMRLSHFPGQLEHRPDVIWSPSLNPTYSHTHSSANTPKGSGLITHWSVWRKTKARTAGGLMAVGGHLLVRLLEPTVMAPTGLLSASFIEGWWWQRRQGKGIPRCHYLVCLLGTRPNPCLVFTFLWPHPSVTLRVSWQAGNDRWPNVCWTPAQCWALSWVPGWTDTALSLKDLIVQCRRKTNK